MKRNKLFFVAMPLLALCLTSCGEYKKVKNYLVKNCEYSYNAYHLDEQYSDYNSFTLVGLSYYPNDDAFTATSYNVQYTANNSLTIMGFVKFDWGKFDEAKYLVTFEYEQNDIRQYYCEVQFYRISLGVCPNLYFSMAFYQTHENSFPSNILSSADISEIGAVFLKTAVSGCQNLISTYIDSEIELW